MFNSKQPPDHRQVASVIAFRIAKDTYKSGERMPSVYANTDMGDVSSETLTAAYKLCETKSWLIKEPNVDPATGEYRYTVANNYATRLLKGSFERVSFSFEQLVGWCSLADIDAECLLVWLMLLSVQK